MIPAGVKLFLLAQAMDPFYPEVILDGESPTYTTLSPRRGLKS